MHRKTWAYPGIVAGVLLISCLSFLSPQDVKGAIVEEGIDGHYIKDIPFFLQEDYYCGPASLASILNFYGLKIGQEEIAKDVYLPKLKGALTIDLLSYARERGFKARFYKGDMADLKNNIMAGRPLILFLNLGNSIYPIRHYVVVVGFNNDDGYVITYSGREKDKVYTYKRLLSAWRKTGFGTLKILPGVVGRNYSGG